MRMDKLAAAIGLMFSAVLIVAINYQGDNSRDIMLHAGEANNRHNYRHFQLLRRNFEKKWYNDFTKEAGENLRRARAAEKATFIALKRDETYDVIVNLLGISLAVLGLYGLFKFSFILYIAVLIGSLGSGQLIYLKVFPLLLLV